MAELADLLQASFSRFANSPFHRVGTSEMSFRELDLASAAVAGFLSENVPRGQPVMIAGEREHEMLACLFGCMRAGNPYVPSGELVPPHRCLEMARIAGCTHILQCGKESDLKTGEGLKLHSFESIKEIINSGKPMVSWQRCSRGSEIVYILFTSGSTGVPKGVKVSAGNLESFLDWTLNSFGYASRPMAFLNQAPFHFDLSVYELFNSATSGGSIFSLPGRITSDPEKMFQNLFSHGSGLEVWVSTPSFLRYCVSHPEFREAKLEKLGQFVLIGEIFPLSLAREILQRFPRARVFNFYGPTEATVAHTVFEVTESNLAMSSTLPVGMPKPGSRVLIENNEIVLIGPNVAWGYVNNDVETARKFSNVAGERHYRTGDLGELDESGVLWFKGRADTQVKINGFRVELGEIENRLARVPGIQSCCVMLIGPEDGSPWIAAFVQYGGDAGESELSLRNRLKLVLGEKLPGYMIPKRFIRVTEMPLNRNGKLDRAKLKDSL